MLRSSLAAIAAVVLSGCDVPTYPTGVAPEPLSQAEQQVLTAAISQSLNDPASAQSSDQTERAASAADRVLCGGRGGRSRFGGIAGFGGAGPRRSADFEPTYSWDRTDDGGIGATRSDLRAATPIVPDRLGSRFDSRPRPVPSFDRVGCLVAAG